MTDIHFHELEHFLKREDGRDGPSWPPVCLLFGEDVLYQKALDKVLTAFLGNADRNMNYEALDGSNENVSGALERINTYSLLSTCKIIALTDARVFHSRQNMDRIWEQAAKAAKTGKMKKAARHFLDLLRVQGMTLDDMTGESPAKVFKTAGADLDWVPAVTDYCRQNGLQVSAAADPQQALEQAIDQGFPAGHHLIVTTAVVDKRRRLYKVIREKGLVVDCSVPRGDRKADRMAQESVLDAVVEEVLRENGKHMDPGARRALYELTGFDLRTVAANVEKLAHFTGERDKIEAADIKKVLQRTRRDPLYELTEAVANRNLGQALFYLQSLLNGGDFDHPLPLLAAVANQMRRLLVAKEFTASSHGRLWHPGCSYPQFQSQVLPAIKAYDEALQTRLDAWHLTLNAPTTPQGKKRRKKTNATGRSDLFLAAKGRSPYPIYKTLQKAERFTLLELKQAVQKISAADQQLKRSGQSGRLILEHLILWICQPATMGNSKARPNSNRPPRQHP